MTQPPSRVEHLHTPTPDITLNIPPFNKLWKLLHIYLNNLMSTIRKSNQVEISLLIYIFKDYLNTSNMKTKCGK